MLCTTAGRAATSMSAANVKSSRHILAVRADTNLAVAVYENRQHPGQFRF